MNLYLIERPCATSMNDTYDQAVVCAESPDEAVMIHPSGKADWDGVEQGWGSWVSAEVVRWSLLGPALESVPKGVVCASFNAG